MSAVVREPAHWTQRMLKLRGIDRAWRLLGFGQVEIIVLCSERGNTAAGEQEEYPALSGNHSGKEKQKWKHL